MDNPETCQHEWKEQATAYKTGDEVIDQDAPRCLSRYCELCGQSEAYHGGEKRWIKSGNIYHPLTPKDCYE